MPYPRHPSEVLRDIRGDNSTNQMCIQMESKVGWPRTRWANLEKESQDFHDEYIMDLVEAGLLRATDKEFEELKDWLETQDQIADAASATKYQLQKAVEEADGPEDLEDVFKELGEPEGPGKVEQDYQDVPPEHVRGLEEVRKENEELEEEKEEDKEPPRQTNQEWDNFKKELAGAPWAKIVSILLMVGMGVLLVYGVSWAVRNVQIGKNTPATPIPAVTVQEKVVVVTATPKVVATATSASQAEVLPTTAPVEATNKQGYINLRDEQITSSSSGGELTVATDGDIPNWSGAVSSLVIPEGWRVIVYYETWLPPDYAQTDPDKKGYVEFGAGTHSLPLSGLQVYSDLNLSNRKRTTEHAELNDKIQEIYIYPSGPDTLTLGSEGNPNIGSHLNATWQE